ncbi:hypothetical protein Tmar_2039 [Thermaerobacter marianensis DSM 12885]|uniref:DUF4015 domain-containing protein n=1 Tax=Thermaerobacter marianensis (strain ATCC 700841 / DSM 12885 / JCM 10246 / 7p75a) TaxID=644966 RepID=E6SJG5_THEM7|nr:hypothetical protein [Thermaerobacter marianensis]ADU52120.1 hypothetical protein Tmar_2039 [Thermaerobacter marianensis DSM 12885]
MRGIVTYDRRDLRALREMGYLPFADGSGAGAPPGDAPAGRPAAVKPAPAAPVLPFPVHVFYEIKSVLGRVDPPVPGAHNMISCFGDNQAVEREPGLAAVGPGGMRAVRGTPYFDWDWVCPSDAAYRQRLLDLVEQAAAAPVAGLRLDTVSFPREGFCQCPRCRAAQAASGLDPATWRAAAIAGFVREAVARMGRQPGAGTEPAPRPPLSLTLYPDPYGDHQFRRFGLDLAQLAPLVDFFVVPIYDLHYSTTYWVETLAWGFRDLLGAVPFVVELYALNVDRKALLKAARVADAYADGILLAYERAPEAVRILEELGAPPAHSRLAGR